MTSLANKARSAVIWNTGFNLFRDLLQFGTMLVLVRLLEPKSYGEFALVTGVMGMLSILSHNSFMAYLIQVRDESDARYQDQFTASAVIQGAIFLLTNLAAVGLRWVPDYAPIAPYLHVMSITFLLEWPCELRRKMLERAFDWKTLRLLHATGLVTGAILAVTMAKFGAGTYALLVPGLISATPFIIDLFLIRGWRPTWDWSWQAYRPAFKFGISRMAAGAIASGRTLLESSVLTAVVGFAALGIFGRSIGLAQMFCQKFASQLLYAIYPLLTRIDSSAADSGRLGGLVLRMVAWVAFPAAAVFARLADPIVNVLYGEKWDAVVVLLPFAMAWGALSAISASAYTLLLSRGQTRKCLYTDIGILLGTGVALLAALPHGLVNYLQAVAILQVLVVGILLVWLHQSHALTWNGARDAFLPPAVGVGLAWLLTEGVATPGGPQGPTLWAAVLWGAVFCWLYLAVLRFGFRRQIAELIVYLPAKTVISKLLMLKKTREDNHV